MVCCRDTAKGVNTVTTRNVDSDCEGAARPLVAQPHKFAIRHSDSTRIARGAARPLVAQPHKFAIRHSEQVGGPAAAGPAGSTYPRPADDEPAVTCIVATTLRSRDFKRIVRARGLGKTRQ